MYRRVPNHALFADLFLASLKLRLNQTQHLSLIGFEKRLNHRKHNPQ